MSVQGISNSLLLPTCSHFWVQNAKTASTHIRTHTHTLITFAVAFHIPLSAALVPLPPLYPLPYAASNWFLYCERQKQWRRRRRRIIFLFASRVLLSPGSLRSLFSSFCCYLLPFVPCILGTVAVYAPLRFASFTLSLSHTLSQWFDCRASRSPLSVV